MSRGPDFYAKPAAQVAALAPAAAAALALLPPLLRTDVEQHRTQILADAGVLGARMRFIETTAADQGLPAAGLIEIWAWVSFLAIVRGYRGSTTVAGYARTAAQFLAWAAANELDYTDIAMQDFDGWQKWLYLRLKHGPRWRSRQAAAVRSFYDWRQTRGLGPNCAKDLRSPRIPSSLPKKYTIAQLQGLLVATQQRRSLEQRLRDKTIVLMLLSTGMRREELCQLDLQDLDLGKTVGVVRIQGKGSKQREVSFEGPVVDLLREWLLTRDALAFPVEPNAVFVSLQSASSRGAGKRISLKSLENLIAVCAKLAGLRDWGVHRFRITFATSLYDAGHELEEIRILMGHENIETTRRYVAVSEKARRTRLSSTVQHQVLGTKRAGQPRWVTAAMGGRKA